MAPSRIPRTSAVLIAFTWVVTSSAIDFDGQNGITQSELTPATGTVAPRGEAPTTNTETEAKGFDNPVQWPPSSSNNEVSTTAPNVPSSGSGGWSQPKTPTTAESPTVYSVEAGGDQTWSQPTTVPASEGTPPSQSSGLQDQELSLPPTSDTGYQEWTQPSSNDTGNNGWEAPTSSQGGETGGTEDHGVTPTSRGTGDQASSQQTDWNSPSTPSGETPPTGEAGGFDDINLGVDSSNSGENGSVSPGGESPGGDGTDDWGSLECSGSDEEESSTDPTTPSSSTDPTNLTTTEATTISSDTWDNNSTSPTTLSNWATLAASGGDDQSTPAASGGDDPSTPTMSTASSGTGDQGGSQATQTSTASSSNTESSSNTASSSDTPIHEGSDSTHQSTTTGEHATFGTVTSKSGECVIGNPNKYISTADIDWIWDNRIGPDAPKRDANTNILNNNNFIMDKIVANKGTLNYCVRWDSTKELSRTVASKFKNMLERQYAAWNHWLIGYNCWPHNDIKINIVGFAVKEASLLDWSDDSFGPITVGDLDVEGVPQCNQTCYRFYDNNAGSWSDTSACKGEPFDMSLWPKQGLVGGFGYDWGQNVNLENMMENIDQEQLEILSHEIGHGFGLPDFYQPEDKPNENWPKCIMMAGSSNVVTDSDGWMLRRALEHLKPRYNFE